MPQEIVEERGRRKEEGEMFAAELLEYSPSTMKKSSSWRIIVESTGLEAEWQNDRK
jgi:hypothetical protein